MIQNRLSAFLTKKCPNCEVGPVFKKVGRFSFFKMHTHCSNCNHKFEREPGFFVGALYVFYGLNVAVSIATFIVTYVLYSDIILFGIANAILLVGLSVFNYKYSLLIWMYLFTQKGENK